MKSRKPWSIMGSGSERIRGIKKMLGDVLIIISLTCLLLLIVPGVYAQGVTITKQTSKALITEGDTVKVSLLVRNGLGHGLNATLYDSVPGFADIYGEDAFYFGEDVEIAVEIQPGSEASYEYDMRFPYVPQSLDNKELPLGKAYMEYNGTQYTSNSVDVTYKVKEKVTPCNFNFECEQGIGETFENCFQDCVELQYEEIQDLNETVETVGTDSMWAIYLLVSVIAVLFIIIIFTTLRKNK